MSALDKKIDALVNDIETNLVEVRYRYVYLKPNHYSDEAIAVGVLAQSIRGVYFKYVMSDKAYQIISDIYGVDNAEQLRFALNVMRVDIQKTYEFDVNSYVAPSTLLWIGQSIDSMCNNMADFCSNTLQMSSSLYSTYGYEKKIRHSLNQEEFRIELYNSVSQVDAFQATRIFKGTKIKLPNSNSKLTIPIYGQRIIGAPISFRTKKITDAKTRAEAYIARFNYAKDVLGRESFIYVLAPSLDDDFNPKLIDECMGELELVANSCGVKVRKEKSVTELAKILLYDDVA